MLNLFHRLHSFWRVVNVCPESGQCDINLLYSCCVISSLEHKLIGVCNNDSGQWNLWNFFSLAGTSVFLREKVAAASNPIPMILPTWRFLSLRQLTRTVCMLSTSAFLKAQIPKHSTGFLFSSQWQKTDNSSTVMCQYARQPWHWKMMLFEASSKQTLQPILQVLQ